MADETTPDIVERLRDDHEQECGMCCHTFTGVHLMVEAADEIERLRTAVDPSLSFRDLETKVRDGSVNMRIVWGDGNEVAMRWLAMTMWHAILGDANEEPENYRMAEFTVKPKGEFYPLRMAIEVIKPGARSSHEIRRDLEAELERHKNTPCDDYADQSA